LAAAVERVGAAETVSPNAQDAADAFARAMDAATGVGRYAVAAKAFAAKYHDFDPAVQLRRITDRVKELLMEPSPPIDAGRQGGPAPTRRTVFAG